MLYILYLYYTNPMLQGFQWLLLGLERIFLLWSVMGDLFFTCLWAMEVEIYKVFLVALNSYMSDWYILLTNSGLNQWPDLGSGDVFPVAEIEYLSDILKIFSCTMEYHVLPSILLKFDLKNSFLPDSGKPLFLLWHNIFMFFAFLWNNWSLLQHSFGSCHMCGIKFRCFMD